MSEAVTLVEIDYFKPNSFCDAWIVETEDRGRALRNVMAQYPNGELKFLNLVSTNLRSVETAKLIKAKRITKDNFMSNQFAIRMFQNFVPIDAWLDQVRDKLTEEEYLEFDRLMREASEKTQIDHFELRDNATTPASTISGA